MFVVIWLVESELQPLTSRYYETDRDFHVKSKLLDTIKRIADW